MKKILAMLMVVAVLAGFSAMAFAGTDSPSQDVPGGGTPAEEPKIEDVEIVAADELNTEVKEGLDFRIGTEGLEDFDEEIQEAVNTAVEQKEDAVDALTPENLNKILPADVLKDADGKTAVCSDPEVVWCMNNNYPCTVVYSLERAIDVVLLFADGEWSVADATIEEAEDGSFVVSYAIDQVSLFTNVAFK